MRVREGGKKRRSKGEGKREGDSRVCREGKKGLGAARDDVFYNGKLQKAKKGGRVENRRDRGKEQAWTAKRGEEGATASPSSRLHSTKSTTEQSTSCPSYSLPKVAHWDGHATALRAWLPPGRCEKGFVLFPRQRTAAATQREGTTLKGGLKRKGGNGQSVETCLGTWYAQLIEGAMDGLRK